MSAEPPPFDAVLIINPRSYVDRRRHIEAQLNRIELTGELIHRWDVEDIDAAADRRHFTGGELTRGQKSCALKHVEALRRIVARGCARALVLEDDVVLADGFLAGTRAALAETARERGPYVLFLGSGGNFFTPRSQRRPGQRVYPANKGRFADSYVIDAATARLRLHWIDTHRMHKPIDVTFDAIDRELGIRLLWLEPPVVEQGSKNGLFDSTLESAPPRPLQGMRFALEKLRRKYLYQLWR